MPTIFTQYTKPGVYTTVSIDDGGVSLFGDQRIAVLIGEGQESFTQTGLELHRGSSAVADELKVEEDISSQIDGVTRAFTTSYSPIVHGDGKGTITTIVTDIQVVDGQGNPLQVVSLTGATGKFQLQSIPLPGSGLFVTYYFKRTDLLVTAEDLSFQVPVFASFTGQTGITIGTTVPGFVGNKVKLTFTLASSGSGVADAVAVSGVGTDTLSIELRKTDNTVRTIGNIQSLILAGIPTHSAGNLTVQAVVPADLNTAGVALAQAAFTGGDGQGSNTVFKVENVPIVDGTNGGVVTNLPTSVTVTVNGVAVTVASLDGLNGLITLAAGVPQGAVLKVTYYTNRWQDTYDELPAINVSQILNVGYAPGRADFINGTDYVLLANKIYWGAAVVTAAGQATAGYTPFDTAVITTTLVDQKVYLRPATGLVDGSNNSFTLADSPTDGSGLSRVTDNPTLLSVYVGTTPSAALAAGPVHVIRVSGATGQITLADPPAVGLNVYATYWRNTLNDHTWTLTVVNPGIVGQGTYTVANETGAVVPPMVPGTNTVADANFATAGILWPFSSSDFFTAAGVSPDETITLTFQEDGLTYIITPAIQATNTNTVQNGLRFRATSTGTAPNGVTSIQMVAPAGVYVADNAAITVVGEVVTVSINRGVGATPDATNPTRSLQDIITMFTAGAFTTTKAGVLIAEASGSVADLTTLCAAGAAAFLAGGAAAVTGSYSNRFKVSSSRTAGQSAADGLGLTGGATTGIVAPALGSDTVGTNGYLGQTYQDSVTGVSFTIVDPQAALGYGYSSAAPSPAYHYKAGDKLTFVVADETPWTTSNAQTLAIPGLRLKVGTTFGMFATDTALVNTYNKAGAEPKVGDYYYVDLQIAKTAQDFGLKLYTDLSDVYAAYGQPTPDNKLSLAAMLMTANGNGTFYALQVQKDKNQTTASSPTYMAAIDSLAVTLPGSDRKADMIQVMTTDPTVQQYLSKFLTIQATVRNKGEATTVFGMPISAKSTDASNLARSIANKRCRLVGNNGAILTLSVADQSVQFAVGGEFLAAAFAGLVLNPANDVATSMTKQTVVSFDKLITKLTDPAMDLAAAQGVIWLTEVNGALIVRDDLSTDVSSVATKEPPVTTQVDNASQIMRKALDQFVARKNLNNIVTNIQITANATLQGLVDNEVLDSYKPVKVTRDANDPTIIYVQAAIKPIFAVKYIVVNFTVNTRLS